MFLFFVCFLLLSESIQQSGWVRCQQQTGIGGYKNIMHYGQVRLNATIVHVDKNGSKHFKDVTYPFKSTQADLLTIEDVVNRMDNFKEQVIDDGYKRGNVYWCDRSIYNYQHRYLESKKFTEEELNKPISQLLFPTYRIAIVIEVFK